MNLNDLIGDSIEEAIKKVGEQGLVASPIEKSQLPFAGRPLPGSIQLVHENSIVISVAQC